jgi:hypothetical protein
VAVLGQYTAVSTHHTPELLAVQAIAVPLVQEAPVWPDLQLLPLCATEQMDPKIPFEPIGTTPSNSASDKAEASSSNMFNHLLSARSSTGEGD